MQRKLALPHSDQQRNYATGRSPIRPGTRSALCSKNIRIAYVWKHALESHEMGLTHKTYTVVTFATGEEYNAFGSVCLIMCPHA